MRLHQSAFKYKEIRLLKKAKVYIPVIAVIHKMGVLFEMVLGGMLQHEQALFL